MALVFHVAVIAPHLRIGHLLCHLECIYRLFQRVMVSRELVLLTGCSIVMCRCRLGFPVPVVATGTGMAMGTGTETGMAMAMAMETVIQDERRPKGPHPTSPYLYSDLQGPPLP